MNDFKAILAAFSLILGYAYAEEEIILSQLKYEPAPLGTLGTFEAPPRPLPDWKLFHLPFQGKIYIDPNKEDSQKDTLKGEMNYRLQGSSIAIKGGVGVDKTGSRSIEFGISWGGDKELD